MGGAVHRQCGGLVVAGDGPAIDGGGAGRQQGLRAGVERRAGGGHVIDDEDGAVAHAARGRRRRRRARWRDGRRDSAARLAGGCAGDAAAPARRRGWSRRAASSRPKTAAWLWPRRRRRPPGIGTAVTRSRCGGRSVRSATSSMGAAVAVRLWYFTASTARRAVPWNTKAARSERSAGGSRRQRWQTEAPGPSPGSQQRGQRGGAAGVNVARQSSQSRAPSAAQTAQRGGKRKSAARPRQRRKRSRSMTSVRTARPSPSGRAQPIRSGEYRLRA